MDCCNENNKDRKSGIKQGIIYGLIPHIGCIAFIIGSVLGVTVLMKFFKPLLMNAYFFHWIFAIALGFATISSALYLRKHKMLSWGGIKKKKGYLAIMYGSTIGINLILFLVIFPMLANVSFAGATVYNENLVSSLTLQVKIPCPGHAPLISNELKTIPGVYDVEFSFPNNFKVIYGDTTEQEILRLDVFNTYPATLVNSGGNSEELITRNSNTASSSEGSCSGGCGGSSGCGGSCGSPSCSLAN